MKRNILIIITAFVVTLSAIFGIRASADALAVVLGVILGVIASAPTTLLLTYVLMRHHGQHHSPASDRPTSPQPPVVIINASDKPAISTPPSLPPPSSLPSSGRKWTVIGDADPDFED